MDKIRITLYNKDGSLESDRLVDFQTEMYAGPKANHDGPVRIDVQFNTRDQTDRIIDYIKKLNGSLPIDTTKRTTRSAPATTNMSQDVTQDIIQEVKKKENQDQVIEYLREMNFQFICYDHLVDIFNKNSWELNIEKDSHKELQYMVRVLRLAKDPKNDKIDPSLIVGMKIVGDPIKGFHLYQSGKLLTSIKMPWPTDGKINFKVKQKFYDFPASMLIDERSKWRAEDRKVHTNPDYVPTPFYTRWKPFVTIHQPLKIKRKK